jgi:UDP-N-acetyl-2-amino-2-deoxyglucuronate dehydrogenase
MKAMAEIGYGIIGCGNIAPMHAEAIQKVEGARLVAVSDVVEQNAQQLAERFGATPYTDYHELLARDDIQVVNLCIPSGMRAEIGAECAQAGKHIMSEKPLEVNTKRIDALLQAVDEAGVKLACIFQNRFADGAEQLKAAVDAGRFGKLVLGDAYIKWYRSDEYYQSGSWRGTKSLDGGGCLMNQGIHQIDLLLWFFGPVKNVFARTGLVGHEGLEVEDLACAILEFENGSMGVIEGSTAIWPGHPARLEVHGQEGGAALEDGILRFWKFKEERPEDESIRAQMHANTLGTGASDPMANVTCEGHRRQIEDFTDAIRHNRAPKIDGKEGRRAVALIEAIYESSRTGLPVNL